MSDRLRIGVIGVGHLGKAHVRILSELDSCELVGCYDINADRSAEVSEEYGTRAFPDSRKLIEACDAISLVVPTTEHHSCALEILKSDKHLFIEKPIASTVEQAEEIVKLADSRKLSLMVGHIERFNPALVSIRDQITFPSFIEAHRLAPFNFRGLDVAVIFDLMIHDIDLCLHLTNSEVIDIQASASAVISDKMDIANARISFKSGCTANLTASRISPNGMRKLRIFQPNGYISIDFKDQNAEVYRLIDNGHEEPGTSMSMAYGDTGKKIVYSKPNIDKYDMLSSELDSFVRSVASGKATTITGLDGLSALKIASEIETTAQMALDKLHTNIK